MRPYERLTADFLPVHLRSQLHVSYLLTVLICFEQLAYHVPHVCPEKLGLQLQRTEASEPDWSVKFAEQVEAWNARRINYLCSLQKLIDLAVVQLHVEGDTVHGVVVQGILGIRMLILSQFRLLYLNPFLCLRCMRCCKR